MNTTDIHTVSTQLWNFIQILISVLLGGLISICVVWLTLRWTEQQRREDQKYLFYKSLLSTLKAVQSYIYNFSKEGASFNYHKSLYYVLTEKNEKKIHKEQAVYHQKNQSLYKRLLLKKLEDINSLKIEFLSYKEKGEDFDKLEELIKRISHQERPSISAKTFAADDREEISKLNMEIQKNINDTLNREHPDLSVIDELIQKSLSIKIRK